MEDEKPRNHLDLRHRLDQTGKRYGKVIDYKSVKGEGQRLLPVEERSRKQQKQKQQDSLAWLAAK